MKNLYLSQSVRYNVTTFKITNKIKMWQPYAPNDAMCRHLRRELNYLSYNHTKVGQANIHSNVQKLQIRLVANIIVHGRDM